MSPAAEKITAELHVHSRYGRANIGIFPDCTTPLPAIFMACVRKQIHIAAVTDHDPPDQLANLELQRLADNRNYPLIVIPSAEITCREQGRDVHVLVYGLDGKKPIPPRHRSLSDTISAAHNQGAIVVAPHPLFFCGASLAELAANKFDAVEIHNALVPAWFSLLAAAIITRNLNLPQIVGSDAHLPSQIGMNLNLFPDDTKTVSRALAHIKSGNIEVRKRSSPYFPTIARMIWVSIIQTLPKL